MNAPDLNAKHVLVVGLGASGLAAARLVSAKGARVTVADRKSAGQLGRAAAIAHEAGWCLVAGGSGPELLDGIDLAIVSPGVPLRGPLFERATALGIPVWGEIELASRFTRGRIVGITGSNGKSTVTSIIGAALRAAGIPGGTGGNLAVPLADLLSEDSENAVHAIELSSFQLESVEQFHPSIALLLNLSPDHLDRYDSYEAYIAAKTRLLDLQQEGDVCILNADDSVVRGLSSRSKATIYLFTLGPPPERGAGLIGDDLVLNTPAGKEVLMSRSELSLPGDHNVSNALAAALAARLSGVPLKIIHETLCRFTTLPHRLELVGVRRGVSYVNDSKATNLDAAVRAVQAWPHSSVWWILGGRDKDGDWASIPASVWEHVRGVLLIGEAAETIEAALPEKVDSVRCDTLERVFEFTDRAAVDGDVLLLAPACTSFDQFENFAARGKRFCSLAEQRIGNGGADA
jgi:UDP-N-acetylmuramoylalanine--D-glutamate ligase